jgi:hypothetical protein
METPPRRAPLETLGAALALLIAAAACGGSNSVASHSPTPARPSASPSVTTVPSAPSSPTTSPPAVTGSFGVLATRPTTGQYTVTVIGVDGKVAASKVVNGPPQVSCPGAGAVVSLPVSTSDSGVYYQEAGGGVTFMSPTGAVRQAASVPAGTGSRRSMFAVSPDDKRIAVVVADFNSSGAATRLYVEDLGGGNHVEIYSESGARTLWPIGWHGNGNLALGVVPSCTQGGGPFCCGVQEIHVVDPATANRRFILGAINSCTIAGTPSLAGVVCEAPPQATALSWTDTVLHSYSIPGPVSAYLSPSGASVAFVDNIGTTFTGGGSAMAGMFTCLWIDETHVLAGGDVQQQARLGNLADGTIVPVAAQGECAGRIPGGL